MALSQDRNTPRRDGEQYEYPVAAATVCYAGGLAAFTGTGVVVAPAITGTTQRVVGVFEERADNATGGAGAITAKVRRGVFRFKNSASADAITLADVGSNCFVVDDEQVAKTNGSNTRSVAGVVRAVDAQGVWVQI